MSKSSTAFVIGMDLGDKTHELCVLDGEGEIVRQDTISNNKKMILRYFDRFDTPERVIVAMETGTHSPWISELLQVNGFQILVANSRKLRMIWNSNNKNDVRDAEMLARIARFDPKLLCPITHRSEEARSDLALIKARHALVRNRANLINFVRGLFKSLGMRVPQSSPDAFSARVRTLPV